MVKISLISLGCPKNRVDSDNLLARLHKAGMSCSADPEDSDIILINTCGFIEDAKKESIEEILNCSRYKDDRNRRKLVVFGCLAKRYGDELKKEIPEIDALWGVGAEKEIVEYCRKVNPGDKQGGDDTDKEFKPGGPSLFESNPFAYLKISEGCDRGCSYCVIPAIRGNYRSRNPDRILKEAEGFIRLGKKELILVAQDITSFGKDLKDYNLCRLVRDIALIRGDFRIRLLYLNPSSISDELLETMGAEEKVCNYVDMPLQHTEKKILGLMKRGGGRRLFESLITRIREKIPGVSIRTTLMVGFPHETDRDFHEMVAFVRKMRFERLGVFLFSKEEGTPAYSMKGQVSKRIKQKRYDKIMRIQSSISLEHNKALVGKTLTVLVDEIDGDIAVSRLCSQAPEIDGVVFLKNENIRKGDFVRVNIEEAYDYDLRGVIAE